MRLRPYMNARGHYALSIILRRGWPKMTVRQAGDNATQIMDALFDMGLEIMPRQSPPTDIDELQRAVDKVAAKLDDRPTERRKPRDAFDGFDDVLREMEEKRPWEIK